MSGSAGSKALAHRLGRVAPFALWLLFVTIRGERRLDIALITLAVATLALYSDKTRRLLGGLYPFALLGLVYDAMRFVKNVGLSADRVHDCDLRGVEMSLFGFTIDGVPSTVHDWFQAHPSTVLDLICAVPYGIFLYAAIAFAVYLYIRDDDAMRSFAWTFLVLNIAAFITYHVYPAAPPWYFHSHGCTVDLSTAGNEGPRLAHVDQLLGFRYFHGFYARSNSVFGAVPSLHVSYPLLILLHGRHYFRKPMFAASIVFFVLMLFSAVYLDHHWIVDVILGVAYTLTAHNAVRIGRAWLRDREEPKRDGNQSNGSIEARHAS